MSIKAQPRFLPSGKIHRLLAIFPKALWADIAWNFALRIQGEENFDAALQILLEEAEIVRPGERWRRRMEGGTHADTNAR